MSCWYCLQIWVILWMATAVLALTTVDQACRVPWPGWILSIIGQTAQLDSQNRLFWQTFVKYEHKTRGMNERGWNYPPGGYRCEHCQILSWELVYLWLGQLLNFIILLSFRVILCIKPFLALHPCSKPDDIGHEWGKHRKNCECSLYRLIGSTIWAVLVLLVNFHLLRSRVGPKVGPLLLPSWEMAALDGREFRVWGKNDDVLHWKT